ncbi:MAG: putative porin [Leptospiraceae bacterium]|nr:putative porin [Leptospiraceae bacterium]
MVYLLIFLLFASPVFSEVHLGLFGARNSGEHIFETGNKYPNLSGIRGGSRITYDRNFNFFGLNAGWIHERFSLNSKLSTTGWGVRTGNSRDEDFVMGSTSTERGDKLSLFPLFLYDTAHTFTGTRNFADGNAKSTINERRADFWLKFYFSENAKASPWAKTNSFYLSSGVLYSYYKYELYDVIQFVASPFFYGPIGVGLSYSNTVFDFPLGLGYVFYIGKFRFDFNANLTLVYMNYRDFHKQRALNFIGTSFGSGFIYKAEISYIFSESLLINFSINGHRQFTSGTFRTKGGLTYDDVLSNYLGEYKAYINTKEVNLEFGFIKRFNYTAPEPIIESEKQTKWWVN